MRKVLALAFAVLVVGTVCAATKSSGPLVRTVASGDWTNPGIWITGRVPSATDEVEVLHDVRLDADATVAGVLVRPGVTLSFPAASSRTLASTRNVIVEGVLQMRPSHPAFVHTLRMTAINEAAFVGGGDDPVRSDVGVWVVGGGRLDAVGAAKSGWLPAAGGLSAGASSVTLASAPAGWRAGDEVVVVPTGPGDLTGFEVRRVASVSGATVTLDAALAHPHPAVDGLTPEVANLTRNVRIEGTPTGRTHVFVRSSGPQAIRYAAIRHVGPRRSSGIVAGRYGLHFHHMSDASRGSIVEGVVIRDNGSHSYVPHDSHGITIRDSIAYAVNKTAFWWDRPPGPENDTFDSVWEHNLAANVTPHPGELDLRLSGFQLGTGDQTSSTPTNEIRDSVAVGVRGERVNNGFHWPQASAGVWRFTGNVSHNNQVGAFFWTNDGVAHDVPDFRLYHNATGLMHGAYKNVAVFENLRVVGTAAAAVELSAVSGDARTLTHRDVTIVGAREGLVFGRHNVEPKDAGLLERWVLQGVATPIVVREEIGQEGGRYDLVDWLVDGRRLRCSDVQIRSIHPDTVIRALDANGREIMSVTARGCR